MTGVTFHEGPNAAFCRATTVCNGVQFESVGATLTTDRTCTNLLNCSAGQQIGTNATATSDRLCISCSLGVYRGNRQDAHSVRANVSG